jgi:CO/xanthine dehydrogenase Mo-binding subunit
MTYLVGNAVIRGSKALKEQLLQSAGLFLTLDPTKLSYEAGQVVLPNGSRITAGEFASRAAEQGFAIEAGGSFTFPYPEATTPQHLPIGMPHVKYVFAAQVARVEIDPELGTVEVKDIVAIHDLGKVINRLTAEGQIEGGVAMGIGYALYEEMPLKANGQWVDSFAEYLLPTSMDMPAHLEVQMLEYPEADGPYGAKGLAEICVVPTAPAIANAVYNAVGVRVHSLPITPEKVYKK